MLHNISYPFLYFVSLKMESLSRIDLSLGIFCSAYAHEVATFAASPLANE